MDAFFNVVIKSSVGAVTALTFCLILNHFQRKTSVWVLGCAAVLKREAWEDVSSA